MSFEVVVIGRFEVLLVPCRVVAEVLYRDYMMSVPLVVLLV